MNYKSLWLTVPAIIFCLHGNPSLAGDAEEITEDNWTEMVAFSPDLTETKIKKGKKVTKDNLAEFKKLVPVAMQMLIEKYGLVLKLREYEPVHPSEGYIRATNKYRGQAKILDVGDAYNKRGIEGYVAGLPFPNPKSGLEVAWNFYYAYGGDDGEVYYSVYWISASNGLEHSEEWRLSVIRATGRTDIEPIPSIESLEKKGIQGAGLTYALAPYDKKGFGAVYYRSIEPKDGQGHTYVPSMRRILKNSFGTRGDTWNGTDLLYEDVRGYSGYPEWMHWKLLGKKTFLLPLHSGVKFGKKQAKQTFDFKNRPHWNPVFQYEPRPVYLLQSTPKLPDYPYSKQNLYVDAETFHILYKESFDKKGELWKIMINSASQRPDMESGDTILGWSGTVVIDIQSEHATAFHVHKARGNSGLNPNMFTVSSLRKRSK
ncbi:MAG: DUF1329 domain-containing protein [Deltaproteobacteria bacterium]|nr:DUF1329 domain-containing protein [Deltaproteobacteria bacterium]